MRALKSYLLLGQGDFLQVLLDQMKPILNRRSNQIYAHTCNDALGHAIMASNAQYDNKEVIERLHVTKWEATVHESGWQIFTLDYSTTTPLNTIFHKVVMNEYRKVFSFLLKLKRARMELSDTWTGSMARTSNISKNVAFVFRKLTHKCHLFVHEMLFFVRNLESYFMFDVLETAWVRFKKHLTKSKSLDNIIRAHEMLLEEISVKCFLSRLQESPCSSILRQKLDNILHIILRASNTIKDVQSKIVSYELSDLDSWNEEMSAGETKDSDWSGKVLDFKRNDARSIMAAEASNGIRHVEGIWSEFKEVLQVILKNMFAMNHCRILTSQLNFNGIYEKMAFKQKVKKKPDVQMKQPVERQGFLHQQKVDNFPQQQQHSLRDHENSPIISTTTVNLKPEGPVRRKSFSSASHSLTPALDDSEEKELRDQVSRLLKDIKPSQTGIDNNHTPAGEGELKPAVFSFESNRIKRKDPIILIGHSTLDESRNKYIEKRETRSEYSNNRIEKLKEEKSNELSTRDGFSKRRFTFERSSTTSDNSNLELEADFLKRIDKVLGKRADNLQTCSSERLSSAIELAKVGDRNNWSSKKLKIQTVEGCLIKDSDYQSAQQEQSPSASEKSGLTAWESIKQESTINSQCGLSEESHQSKSEKMKGENNIKYSTPMKRKQSSFIENLLGNNSSEQSPEGTSCSFIEKRWEKLVTPSKRFDKDKSSARKALTSSERKLRPLSLYDSGWLGKANQVVEESNQPGGKNVPIDKVSLFLEKHRRFVDRMKKEDGICGGRD